MVFRFVLLLTLGFFASSLQANPVVVALPGFQCTDSPFGVRLPAKLSALRALAKHQEEQTGRIEQWEGYQTIDKLLRFEGLAVEVITFTNDPEKYHLAAVTIESPHWSVSPFRAGQSARAALKRLGVAQPGPQTHWHFEGTTDSLYLETRGGRVVRLVYACYTG